jgi:arylsulfatase B
MQSQAETQARHLTVVAYGLPHATRNASGAWSWQDAATECGGTASSDEKTNFKMATECVDSELGLLFANIPDLDRTLVVFMGDNGTEKQLAEGHFADNRGKGSVYESGIRVPLLIADGAALQDTLDNGGALPTSGSYRLGAGVTVSDPASAVDLYATVADYLALSSATCTVGSTCARDSLTMRPLLTGASPVRDETWTETFSKGNNGKYTGSAALRLGDHKLVVRVTSANTSCRKYELYDLAEDRWETTNLANNAAYADEKATLIALLDAHTAAMADPTQAKVNWLPTAVCSGG